MTIDINEQERDLLLEILKSAHSSLLDELQHTDGYEYKELLKQKFELLKSLESRFETSPSESRTI
jgi:hypothetical protein